MKELPNPVEVPEIEKAWFAGFFDADGTIYIDQNPTTPTVRSQIGLQASDKWIQEEFSKYFGGNFYFYGPSNVNHWYTTGIRSVAMLITLLPYLKVKKVEAQLAITFYQRYPDEKNKAEFSYSCRNLHSTLRYTERIMELLDVHQEESKAYLAGLFDGDGCVTIACTYNTSQLQVSIASNIWCRKQMEQLKEAFGGTLVRPRNTKGINWLTSSSKGEHFIKTILPYLKLKRKQASLALEFNSKRKQLPQCGSEEKRYLLGQRYKHLISSLNQRD